MFCMHFFLAKELVMRLKKMYTRKTKKGCMSVGELKVCPFCGEKAIRISDVSVGCSFCPAKMEWNGTYEELCNMWNFRLYGRQRQW